MMVKGTLIPDSEDGRRHNPAVFLGKAEPGIRDPVYADPLLVAICQAIGMNPSAIEKAIGNDQSGSVHPNADNIVDMLGGPSDNLALGFEEGDGPHILNLPATHPALEGGPERWKYEIAYFTRGSARIQIDADISLHVSYHDDDVIERILTVPSVPHAAATRGYVALEDLFSFPCIEGIGARGRLIPSRDHATIHVMIG